MLLGSASAVYDPNNVVKKGKRWAISAGLRTGYDDNTTTASHDKKGSWFGGVNMLGRYSYPTDTSFFSAATSANGNLFADRPGDIFDFNNGVDLTFAHTFSPRLSLDMSDSFRFGQEPQLTDNNTIYRREGDYINNGFSFGLSYQLGAKWFLDLSFSHDLWHYSDAGLRQDLERQTVSAGPTLRYRLTEATSLSLGYSYTTIMYDQSPRDAESHTATVGVSQSITRRWSASLDTGASMRTEDNVGSKATHTEPFVGFSTTYNAAERLMFNGGLRHSFQETDAITYYFSRTSSGFLSANWGFARNLSSVTTLNLVDSELTNAIAGNSGTVDEWTYVVNQQFVWNISDYLSLDLRYSWTRVDSPLEDRSYRRNVVSVGANFLF
jgi:hypothetical protein